MVIAWRGPAEVAADKGYSCETQTILADWIYRLFPRTKFLLEEQVAPLFVSVFVVLASRALRRVFFEARCVHELITAWCNASSFPGHVLSAGDTIEE